MSMNYFLHQNPCPHCGSSPVRLHIGNSSAGWCFALRVHPDVGIHSLEDWKTRWNSEGVVIRNEYGDKLTPEQMLDRVTLRAGRNEGLTHQDLERNGAEWGPNGLLRLRIGQGGCIGHGNQGTGTWDLIRGHFR